MAKLPSECSAILLALLSGEYEPPHLEVPDAFREDMALDTRRIMCIICMAGERLRAVGDKVHLHYVRGIYPPDEPLDSFPDTSTPPDPGGRRGWEWYRPTKYGRDGKERPALNEVIRANGEEAHYLYAALIFWTLHIAYNVCLDTDEAPVDFVRALAHLAFYSTAEADPDLIDECIMARAELVPLYYECPANMLLEFLHLSEQIAWKSWYDWKKNLRSDAYADRMMRRIARYCKGE